MENGVIGLQVRYNPSVLFYPYEWLVMVEGWPFDTGSADSVEGATEAALRSIKECWQGRFAYMHDTTPRGGTFVRLELLRPLEEATDDERS